MLFVFFREIERRPKLAGHFDKLPFLNALHNEVDASVPSFNGVPGRYFFSFFRAAGSYRESNFLVFGICQRL